MLPLYKRKYFIAIIIFKLFLLLVFSSEYSLHLFQPFVDTFISKSNNPWQYYYENHLDLNAFPYHALMLMILFPFSCLAKLFSCNIFLSFSQYPIFPKLKIVKIKKWLITFIIFKLLNYQFQLLNLNV